VGQSDFHRVLSWRHELLDVAVQKHCQVFVGRKWPLI
jgi:hypothetical protein